MRGEVVLLTRNIVIKGDTSNTWNGQFLTTDTTIFKTDGTSATYQGMTNLNNVEFFKMGQLNNFKAALRFDGSNLPIGSVSFSAVEDCVIHESAGWGVNVINSSNISLKNIDIFDVTQIGFSLDQTTNVSADGITVFGVKRRELALADNVVDKECCLAMCSYTKDTKCTKTSVTNSIVGGCPYAGFIAVGYGCADPAGGSTTNVFKDNVAHSVDGSGACIFPDPGLSSGKTCYQGSDFKAYKNSQASIGVMQETNEARFSTIISVDNTLGVSINLSGETDVEKKAVFKNSFVYGESSDLAKDCPDGSGSATGADCYCQDKMGHMSTLNPRNDKPPHNPSASARPVYKQKSYSTWNAKAIIENVQFINFKSDQTSCGASQRVFGVNRFGSDLNPMHFINGSKFVNVKYDAIINIFDPPQSWAVIDDCGEWPCTMPSNMVYTFKNTVFEVNDGTTALPTFWTAGTTTSYSFQIVSDFTSAANTYPNCNIVAKWNAWMCADPAQTAVPQIGTLLFESLDGDTEDRSVQPVIITNSDGYRNVLNSFMDHTWDGFYTGQLRLSRFPSQILTGKSYTITYTGTPFKNGRYVLQADPAAKGILIKIPYPNAGAYSVKVNGSIVQPQPWDEVTQKPRDIDMATATCGANLFVGVVNYLQFFLTPGCTAVVIPRDAILTSVRLQWTAAEFFAGDGATTFTQRLASVLGVDITRVKIVAVYEGSLNVEVQVLDDTSKQITNTDQTVTTTAVTVTEMTQLKAKLVETLTTAAPSTLGAPILEVQAAIQTFFVAPASSSGSSSNPFGTSTTSGSLSDFVPTFDILQPGSATRSIAISLTCVVALISVLF